jgi:hypothetical protein
MPTRPTGVPTIDEGENMSTEHHLTSSAGCGPLSRAGRLFLAACLISGATLRAADAQLAPAHSDPKAGTANASTPHGARSQRAHNAAKTTATAKPAVRHAKVEPRAASTPSTDEVTVLKQQLAHQEELIALQQKQISKLVDSMEEQKQLLEQSLRQSHAGAVQLSSAQPMAAPLPSLGEVASLQPVIPVAAATTLAVTAPPAVIAPASSAQNAQAQQPIPAYTQRVDLLDKQVENLSKGIAGFHFSGDFRVRGDSILRSSDPDGAAEENIRGRLRVRFNIDRGIGDHLDAHMQIGSGNFDNPLTDDTDFGGSATPGPIFLREAWVNYHPNTTLNLQAGRMYDVFQDGTRFMWDEDVRFDGFQESVGASPEDNALGITRIDFRAGQYVLTNPNIQVLPSLKSCTPAPPQTITTLPTTITTPSALPAACAYLSAGYQPGENVRAADMFDQGVFIKGKINPSWSHYVYSDFVAYRNPDQIALASTSAGLPVLVNAIPGVTLATTLTGHGNRHHAAGGRHLYCQPLPDRSPGLSVDLRWREIERRGVPGVPRRSGQPQPWHQLSAKRVDGHA